MAYIGAEPVPGQNREIDDISSGFNGSATAFTLQVSSTNVSPESANNILVNLGGVMQNPGTDYTIAASTITFTTAPASGLSFWALILGAGINTATVADQTIGTSKVLDNAITADKLAHTSVTAGSYTTADITVDAQGRITAAANGTIAEAEIANNAVTTNKIADDAVTFSKIQNVSATDRILGRDSSGAGVIEEITPANLRTMINVADGATNSPTTTINSNADNRVITGSGTANTLNGESGVTYDGSDFTISSGVLKLTDESSGQQLRIGANGDFFIEHDGSNTVLKNTTGDTRIQNDNNVLITASSGGTERFKVDSSGNATVSNGNLIIGTAGKGIDFSAVSSGSGMTSELLDDYEEGTFTPVPDAGGGVTFSIPHQVGFYTKIGQTVTFQLYLMFHASTITSGNAGNGVAIQGLPYTIKNNGRYNPSFTIGRTYNFQIDDDNRIYSYGDNNSTNIRMIVEENNTVGTILTAGQVTNNTCLTFISGVYCI